MSNFKSGSGNLDFGDDEDDSETGESAGKTAAQSDERKTTSRDSSPSTPDSTDESPSESPSSSPSEQYPYFVRRSNVGDERDTRLEIHVRNKVANNETAFRNELAEQLNVNEVSKTDAREFALLAAFQHPERVAELMKQEGFGAI